MPKKPVTTAPAPSSRLKSASRLTASVLRNWKKLWSEALSFSISSSISGLHGVDAVLAALQGEVLDLFVLVGQLLEVPVVGEVQEVGAQVAGEPDVLDGEAVVLLIQIELLGDQRGALGEIQQRGAIEERHQRHQVVPRVEHAVDQEAFAEQVLVAFEGPESGGDVAVTGEAVVRALVRPAAVDLPLHLRPRELRLVAVTLAERGPRRGSG